MSDVRQNEAGERGALSDLSGERLRELIRGAFLEDGDSGYLDALAAEYLSRPDAPAVDADAAWRNFQEVLNGGEFKYGTVGVSEDNTQTERVLRPRRAPSRRAHGYRHIRRAFAAAAAVVLLFGIATAAGAFPAVSNAIARWTETIFTFERDPAAVNTGGHAAPSLDGEYKDLRSALEANGITAPLAPRRIPDGYELDSVEVVKNELWADYVCAYTDADGLSIIVHIMDYYGGKTDASASFYEKDGGEVAAYDAYGVTHYIMSNSSRLKAVWAYDSFECSISGPDDISTESLIKMIDSIYGED